MSPVKHPQAKAQHLQAQAHPPCSLAQEHVASNTLLMPQQAHLPQGPKLYALSHQAHPALHLGLPQIETPQE